MNLLLGTDLLPDNLLETHNLAYLLTYASEYGVHAADDTHQTWPSAVTLKEGVGAFLTQAMISQETIRAVTIHMPLPLLKVCA